MKHLEHFLKNKHFKQYDFCELESMERFKELTNILETDGVHPTLSYCEDDYAVKIYKHRNLIVRYMPKDEVED
jgi:hypothetical protein